MTSPRRGRLFASLLAVLRKEFIHVRRDRTALFTALLIPLLQLSLFGAIDTTVREVPTIVVDQDRTRHSRELVDQLRATKTFRIDAITSDPRAARSAIAAGDAKVGIVVPPDFHDRMVEGTNANVLVLIDGSDSTVSSQALAAVNGLVAEKNLSIERVRNASGSIAPEAALSAHPIILFNPSGRTQNFIIPGLIAIILQLVAMMQTAIAIVRERENGTFEQLLVTPVDPLGLMLGKVAPYLLIGIAEAGAVLAVMRFAFGVPIHGSLAFLFAMCIVYLFALLALGLYISTLARTQQSAQQVAQLFFLPAVFLSGYIFPASGLPAPLYWLGRLLPVTHMVELMRGIVLRDAGPMELMPHVAALIGMSVLLVWLTVRRFRRVSFA